MDYEPQPKIEDNPITSLANPELTLRPTPYHPGESRIVRTQDIKHFEENFLLWLQGQASEGSAWVSQGPGPTDKVEKAMLGFRMGERTFEFTQTSRWNTVEKNMIYTDLSLVETGTKRPVKLTVERVRGIKQARIKKTGEIKSIRIDSKQYTYEDPFLDVGTNGYKTEMEKQALKNLKRDLIPDPDITKAMLGAERKRAGAKEDYLALRKQGVIVRFAPRAATLGAPSVRLP